MTNAQDDKNKTKQVRIDAGIHKLAKIEAAKSGESLRSFVEGCLADVLGSENSKSR